MGKIESEKAKILPLQKCNKNDEDLLQRIKELQTENQSLKKRLASLEHQLSENCSGTRKTNELQLAEMIIENSPAVLFRRLAADELKDRRMVYVSPNISRFGYQADDFLDNKIMFREIVFPGDTERIQKEIRGYISDNRETYTQVYRITTKSGELRWVEDRTSVIEDPVTGLRYHQGIVIDIHKRKIAEEKLRKSEEKYRRIVETTSEGFLLLDKALKIMDFNSAYAKMVGINPVDLLGKEPCGIRSTELAVLLGLDQKDSSTSGYCEFECEIESSKNVKVPVLIHANTLRSDTGEIMGVMAFVTDMTAHKKALILAGEVQRSLLPDSPPEIPGFDIAGKNIPCEEVGGDYFDYLDCDNSLSSNFSVIVGDITGHGVESALLMSSARAFLRMRASQSGSIADVISDMNLHLTDDVSATGRFMTLFFISFEKQNRSLHWVRAGHDSALLYDPHQDTFEEIKGPGIALGLDQTFQYREQFRDGLKSQQIIILGTDGIWEGFNESGQMFGKDRLKEIIRQNKTENADLILKAVFDKHAEFTAGFKREDDITLVIVKIL